MYDVGDVLIVVGLCDLVLDVDCYMFFYSELKMLLKELKGLGVIYVDIVCECYFIGKVYYQCMFVVYEIMCVDGCIFVIWEVVIVYVWGLLLGQLCCGCDGGEIVSFLVDSLCGLCRC